MPGAPAAPGAATIELDQEQAGEQQASPAVLADPVAGMLLQRSTVVSSASSSDAEMEPAPAQQHAHAGPPRPDVVHEDTVAVSSSMQPGAVAHGAAASTAGGAAAGGVSSTAGAAADARSFGSFSLSRERTMAPDGNKGLGSNRGVRSLLQRTGLGSFMSRSRSRPQLAGLQAVSSGEQRLPCGPCLDAACCCSSYAAGCCACSLLMPSVVFMCAPAGCMQHIVESCSTYHAATIQSNARQPPPRHLAVGDLSKLVTAESREVGSVSWAVYLGYFLFMGAAVSGLLALALAGGQAAYMGGDYWLGRWAAAPDQQAPYWLGVYGGLVVAVIVAAGMRSGLFFIHSLK
jgi:hypothetical protein